MRGVDGAASWVIDHWLAVANAAVAVYAGVPVAVPLLRVVGATELPDRLFALYAAVCHQMPGHSWFIAGYQMAYCQRNTAIYTTMLLVGLLYAGRHRRTGGLPLWLYALLALPMLLDGGAATLGVRDSTPLLRSLTGTLFGAATVWFAYPLIDRLFAWVLTPACPVRSAAPTTT